MNLAFSCSMRLGEILGLTWDCVDISEESIAAGTASVHINKELQRVNRETLKMVTDLYTHILDDGRRQNAQLFEEAFYSGRNHQPQEPAPVAADAALLMKLLQNPEMAALIKTLAKTLQ